MGGLQPPMERVRVWRCKGPSNYTKQALEARHSHVQQVTQSCRICIGNLVPRDKSIGESNYSRGRCKNPMNSFTVKRKKNRIPRMKIISIELNLFH